MTDPRRFRLADLIPFLLVLATAAGARVGYLLTEANNAASDGPFLVQDPPAELPLPSGTSMRGQTRITEQDALIHNMTKENRWFGSLAPLALREERTAHIAPGYPWLVSELERLIPEDSWPTDQVVRWLQCLLGTLTAGLYYLLARRAFPGRLVAILTGLLCALHPFWIVNTANVNDGVLASFLLGTALWLGIRASQVEGAGTCFLFGLALAGLALVRAALLPFSIGAVLWFLRRTRRAPGGWQYGLVAVLGLLLGLAPWTVRNVQVFGDIFPIVDSTYLHLWIGNNSRATGGPLSEAEQQAALLATPELAQRLAEPGLSQPARYRLLGEEVVKEIKNNPAGTVQRRLWAGLCFFFGEDWLKDAGEDWFQHKRLWRPGAGAGTAPTEGPSYPGLLLASLFLMLFLGVLGWRWTYAWRKEAALLALAIMWVPLPYILSHAEGLSGPRLPLDGVLLCYSGFVLACLVPSVAKALLRPKRNES
jgi:hypothetical protein